MNARKLTRSGRWRLLFFLIPFFLLIAFITIASMRITDVPEQSADQIPNALANKQAPHTVLPVLNAGSPAMAPFDSDTFRGRVTLINFWGSWCLPCRQEHPFLMTLAKNRSFTLAGINYKDQRENALRFLGNFGDPFRITGFDPQGRAAIDWGVYGPPETFIVDKNGIILYRHAGPLTPAISRQIFIPIITRANEEHEP